jgi:histone H3/H4
MADDVGLPKSTLQKSIKDLLPKEMRIAGDASDLLVQCCNQFVHLISTQANDISEREKRSTISPEHVIKALEELEFGEPYLDAVRAGVPTPARIGLTHGLAVDGFGTFSLLLCAAVMFLPPLLCQPGKSGRRTTRNIGR